MFEWDEEKRLANLEKHGIDFLDAAEIFLSDHLLLPARSDVEQRKMAVGIVNSCPISVIFTVRDEAIRIISARRARTNEREEYHAHVARRDAKNEKPD